MAKFIAHAPNGQAYQCDSLAEVKQVEGGFKFRKAKKRNGGCGCAGACGNPHCGPKKRNPGTKQPADQYQFAKWRDAAKQMTDAELLYVIKDAREAAKAMRGHDTIAEGWYEDEAFTMADELRHRRERAAGKRRNPAGQGEDYNMAAFAGAVEHGLLPPKNATPDYKKGYAEGARIAKQNKLAVAAALGAFRSTKSQAKAGELLREMAGTASTSTPIGNPRKKRNPVGADPRYVPVSMNPKPKGKYLAHEKEEEQIFASMLSKLPVGVTMKAGKFRVRKLSKGFVVVDGERLSMKDAAAKLHGR